MAMWIPKELAELPYWCGFANKRPSWGEKGAALTGLIYEDVAGGPCGLITDIGNSLVVIDIDHGTAIPDAFPPTFTEYSISGNGVHLFYFTSCKKEKRVSKAQYKIPSRYGVQGEIFVGKHGVRVTGNRHERSIDTITVINHLEFLESEEERGEVEILPPDSDGAAKALQKYAESRDAVTIGELRQMLAGISLNQTQRVKEAWKTLTGHDYSHYDFWLRIGLSIHSLYNTEAGLRVFDEWSSTDMAAYDAEQVQLKWESFGKSHGEGITLATLRALYNLTRYQPEARTTKGIDFSNLRNLYGFVDFYHLRIIRNGAVFFICGDEDLMHQQRIIEESPYVGGFYGPVPGAIVDAVLTDFIQNVLYPKSGISGSRLQECLRVVRKRAVTAGLGSDTFFSAWVRGSETDSSATFDALFGAIKLDRQQDATLAKRLLYTSFMSIIKMQSSFSGSYDMNGGLLLLVGPEQCGKSGFFMSLVPREMRDIFISTWSTPLLSSKEYRDFQIALSGKPFLVIDEFDGLLGNEAQSSSFFKDIVTKNVVEYTPIYESSPLTAPRRAMIFGSSNETMMQLTKSGTRRMWIVRVVGFDWSVINDFNWRGFYKNMLNDFEKAVAHGKTPWLIDSDTVDVLNGENAKIAAKNNVELELEEFFPITQEPWYLLEIGDAKRSPMLLTLSDAGKLLKWRSGNAYGAISKALLARALTNLCREYLKPLQEDKRVPMWLDVTKGVVRIPASAKSWRTLYPVPMTEEEVKARAFNGAADCLGVE